MLSETDRYALEDMRDNMARAARCREIVSEASRRLSAGFKDRFPEVPSKQIAGSGSICRHSYENVQERRVWNTIHEALPALRVIVEAELSQRWAPDPRAA